jgi:uncharacterized protein YbbC (DUF1343 family)
MKPAGDEPPRSREYAEKIERRPWPGFALIQSRTRLKAVQTKFPRLVGQRQNGFKASAMKLGLELIMESRLDLVAGSRVGLIANPASVNSEVVHAADLFWKHPGIRLTVLFGPQHGIRAETQDNMIEWQSFREKRTGLPALSLYGETRKPTREMLSDVDVLVFDVQDIGTRVYTFIYTMALAMESAGECSKRFVVLDRPNPIGGAHIEGNILEPDFESFVGMFPIPMRHGMTIGELALLFNKEFGIECDLEVVRMDGWNRAMWHDQTGLPWVLPSPNMPTLDTATVYPGCVFLEGTNISEGRGTTRPFEILGAPFVDPYELIASLQNLRLPGVHFRPLYFQPTFHKFAGETCGGIQVHVTDRNAFKPVITGLAVISAIHDLWPADFKWKEPPYEYVLDKPPFDVIAGTHRLRGLIETGASLADIEAGWAEGLGRFAELRAKYLLYA